MQIRSKYLAVMAVPVIVLVTATTLSYAADRRAAAGIAAAQHAYDVRHEIRDVLDDLVNAETGTRGYLITGDPVLLGPYQNGAAALPSDLETLRSLVGDSPEQMHDLQDLSPLIVERMDLLRRQQEQAPIRTQDRRGLVQTLERGNDLMTEIRGILARMQTREDARLLLHQGEQRRSNDLSSLIEFAILPLAMLLALFLVLAVSGRMVRRVLRIEENAVRLERGEPLEPSDRSRDEIGELSRLVVQTGTRLIEAQGELRQLATTDPLTGLLNRRGLMPLAEHEWNLSRREERPLAVAFIDVDRLKDVNDALGHAVGDQLIDEVSALLCDTLRSTDVIARVGGDEFCVLLTSDSALDPDAIVDRIQEQVEWANHLPGRTYELSISIGVAVRDPWRDVSIEDLIRRADAAMYRQKRAKRAAAVTG